MSSAHSTDTANSMTTGTAQFAVAIGSLPRERIPWIKYGVEAAVLIAFGILTRCLDHSVKAIRNGFFCTDTTIWLPYRPSTVSSNALWAYTWLLPLGAICIIEAARLCRRPAEIASKYENGRHVGVRFGLRLYSFYGLFALALAINYFAMFFVKVTVGRLRPNFMDICRPNIGWPVCNTTAFIVDYNCTSDWGEGMLNDIHKSFFSGHSSISMAGCGFLFMYFHHRLTDLMPLRVVVPLLQWLSLLFASWVGFTRLSDHKHHWSDVLVGLAIGFVLNVVVWLHVAPRAMKLRKVGPNLDADSKTPNPKEFP